MEKTIKTKHQCYLVKFSTIYILVNQLTIVYSKITKTVDQLTH